MNPVFKFAVSVGLLWHVLAFLRPTLCLVSGWPAKGLCAGHTAIAAYAKALNAEQAYDFYARSPIAVPLLGLRYEDHLGGTHQEWLTDDQPLPGQQLRLLSLARSLEQDRDNSTRLATRIASFYCRKTAAVKMAVISVKHFVLPFRPDSASADGNANSLYQQGVTLIERPCRDLLDQSMAQDDQTTT